MVEELDPSVLQDMLDGDVRAFQQVLDHLTGPVSHYVSRMISHSGEAEDIVQETFIRLWTTRSRFEPGRVKLSTWTHRIAHNLCIDSFRKSQTREKYATQLNTEEVISMEESQFQNDEQKKVHEALMQLSENHRSALVLCHFQGLSNRETAAILDMSVDALESLLRRARAKLKTIIDDERGSVYGA